MRSLTLLGERYRLGPVVGTGGMGAVHRAWDERFEREVAIKVVRSGADVVEQERLRREAQYLARLDHPNLIAVYDAGTDRGRHGDVVWFAMELVHGPDLRRVIADRGRLPTADVARVLEGASGALGALHRADVVHRDLKPANVLLTGAPESGRWEVKLADLGIARLIQADALTMTGQVVGTAAYLSPEQVAGEPVGPASDVYALGLLALEALTGRVAFPGGVAEAAAARLIRSPEVPAALDPAWRALLGAMTARRAADRPSTADVLRFLSRLSRTGEPVPDADGTAVLPASELRPGTPVEELATESMDLGATRPIRRPAPVAAVTGWSPALRPPGRRRRRVVLSAAALLLAGGLAGGGAALAGLGLRGDAVQAAPAPASSATASAPHSSATASAPHSSATARPIADAPRRAPQREPGASPSPSRSAAVRRAAATPRGAEAARERLRRVWREGRRRDLGELAERLRGPIEQGDPEGLPGARP